MWLSLSSIITSFKLWHPLNAQWLIKITDFGMIMLGNNEQFWNAYWPIVTNRFPKVTDNKLVQSLKQYESIVFVPSPITTEVRFEQLEKAY